MTSRRLPAKTFIELCLETKQKTALLKAEMIAFFEEEGASFTDLVFCDHHGGIKVSFYTPSQSKARKISKKFSALNNRSLKLKIKILGPHDWFDKWMLDYKRTNLGRKFEVIPSWDKKAKPSIDSRRIPIILDPKGAFGSGTHETTSLSLRLLETVSGKFKTVFDAGTGTGILSVGASKLGAKEILAVDLDAASVHSARENLVRNQCPGSRVLRKDVLKLGKIGPVDLVLANLFSVLLVNEKERIFRWVKPGKYLIVSGILKSNGPKFLKDFRDERFRCLQVLKSRRWIAFLYQRKMKKSK